MVLDSSSREADVKGKDDRRCIIFMQDFHVILLSILSKIH